MLPCETTNPPPIQLLSPSASEPRDTGLRSPLAEFKLLPCCCCFINMSAMRRRRHAGPEDDELTESLLHGGDEQQQESIGQTVDTPRGRRGAIIVYPGPFNLESFLRQIFAWWHQLIGLAGQVTGSLTHSLRGLLPQSGGAQAITLSLIQEERLTALRDKIAIKFDSGNPEHQEGLRQLWALAFPGTPCLQLKSPEWKDMGWQGVDPATDFRGAGQYGLDNLLYLGTQHPSTWDMLRSKTQGSRPQWDYPFAVAGLNLTFMLSDVLELHAHQSTDGGAPRKPAARAFVRLLEGEVGHVAFEELFVITFTLLDRTFLEMKASYMEFNTVLKHVREKVESTLVHRTHSTSLDTLRAALLGHQ